MGRRVTLAGLSLFLLLTTLGGAAQAQPATPIPGESVYTLAGSGTTNPSKLFWYIMDLMMAQSRTPMLLTYRGIGSGNGMIEFIGEANGFVPFNDFGSGDVPMDQKYVDLWASQNKSLTQIPIMVGPVGVFFNLPGITALNMNACTLTKVFQGTINRWNDPIIQAQNPGVALPNQLITVFTRKSGSSSTFGLTTYLKKANALKNAGDASCQWTLNAGTQSWNNTSGNKTWTPPAGASFAVRDGSDLMSDALLATQYSIGYIEAGHGSALGLSEVALNNTAGVSLTSSQGNTSAAIDVLLSTTDPYKQIPNIATNPGASWVNVSMIMLDGPQTFPINLITFVYAPLQVYGYKGALLKAFLQMLLSPTGQAAVSQFEFTRLPPSLLAVAQAGVNAIQVIGDQTPGPWIFETLTGPNSYADNSTNTTSAGRLGNSGWVGTGLGQAASTISANRLSWATYQRNYNSLNVSLLQGQVELLTNQLDASQSQVQLLQGTVTALNASLAALSRQVAALAPAPPPPARTVVEKLKENKTAVAAIVLAVFALVAAVVALIRSMATARQANKYQHALGGAGGPANL